MTRHLSRGELRKLSVASPAIVSAISLGRIPDRDPSLPHVYLTPGGLFVPLPRARTRDNSFLYRMPAGIPGDVNRAFTFTTEPNILDANYPFLAYGLVCVMDQTDFQIRPAGGSTSTNKTDGAVVFYGVLVRPFPTSQTTTSVAFGGNPLTNPPSGTPPTSGLCDVMKRGYMTVLLQGATAANPGGPVWIQATGASANTTTDVCGGFHAANDAGTVQAGNAGTTYFRGGADANGNTEVAWNL